MSENATYLLLYTYVDDIVDRRPPHRAGHLERIQAEKDAGRLIMAGAVGDPPSGGAFVFQNATREDVERFVAGDPYVAAGLVVDRRIEPWTLV